MELDKYRQIIQDILQEHGAIKSINEDVEPQIVFDTERNHYQSINSCRLVELTKSVWMCYPYSY